jgi:beta-glucosidase
LPLSIDAVRTIAVLGRLAALENTGDNGSSRVRPPYVVTALEGLRRYLGEDAVVTSDESDLAAAAEAARTADAVVVVVGMTAIEEGEYIPGDIALGQAGSEAAMPDDAHVPDAVKKARKAAPPRPNAIGGDRTNLNLPDDQIALIETAAASGRPVIVVIVAGSAVMVEAWHEKVGAILQTFYSGMEGGTALADMVFGDISPSGKLPFTVASDARHYPHFDRDATSIHYGMFHGYTLMDRAGTVPRYPFGHGLSYARFAYRGLKARVAGDAILVSVAVRNDGGMGADEVVQAYVSFPGGVERPKKLLKAFQRISLDPGETRIVDMAIPLESLAWRNPATHGWEIESGMHGIHVGGSSAELISVSVCL